jgi:hypothetical protein
MRIPFGRTLNQRELADTDKGKLSLLFGILLTIIELMIIIGGIS